MPLFRIQTTLKGKSGIPGDVYINNWYVEGPPPSGSNYGDICNAIWDFYKEGEPVANGNVRNNLSPVIAQGGHEMKVYRMEDPKPRNAVFEVTKDLGAIPGSGAAALPSEVAIALSFRAEYVSGEPKGRRRGRVFIGPLAQNVVAVDANSQPVIATGIRTRLTNAAAQMKTALNTAGYVWVVHSPTTGNAARFPVAEVWCDDSFDTIRSRGLKGGTKTKVLTPQISLAA